MYPAFWLEPLAPSLSTEVLKKAKAGIYTQFEVRRGLPTLMPIKYFTQAGELWQIAPVIRAMVKFLPINLLHGFSHLGRFDLVFCRNVLIYFDQATKTARPYRRHYRTGRLPRARRRRDRGRPHQPLQVDCRQKRGLYVQPENTAFNTNVLSFSLPEAVAADSRG